VSKLRGRFDGPTSLEMQRFGSSVSIDLRMLDEDIDGSKAHATMLGETGLIAKEEAEQLCNGLDRVGREIRSGEFRPGEEHDDIHMAVEFRLGELLGAVAGKLHTARSRNDQVATDVRLWLKRSLAGIDAALRELALALLDRIESDGRALIPGYTHLQRGQPILLGHHLLAHVWALTRDRGRFADALARLDRSPLGACAMAGTSHPIDRERTAEILGFNGIVENAMDAVSARDHELEVAAACAIAMTHLSRMAEELVLWSSAEFDLVRLSDSYATGSSIMPQKRNPDAAELVRGKAASVHGDLVTLLGLVKSLPLAYNRDLQESRGPLFHAVETLHSCLSISKGIWRTLELRQDRFAVELQGDSSLATELADMLVGRGVPFREAHEAVGGLVRWCEKHGRELRSLDRAEAARHHPGLDVDLAPLLDPRAVAERKTSRGGTAWSEIERQLGQLRERLA
jgi:argininosuccinate lyase